MATLTIRIDAKLAKALDRLAKRTKRTRSAVARDLLNQQLWILRFREARRKTLPLAQKQGFFTDEDVFRAIS